MPGKDSKPVKSAGVIDDSKKFYRDGARYVCSSCKKKFFTKDDVEQCFDAHMANP